MMYTECLDKVVAHGLTRDAANTLVFNAESYGEQSLAGVVVVCTEIPDTLRYSYDVFLDA